MRDHKYFVYIRCSRSGTLYIGNTNSIYCRALQAKTWSNGGILLEYGDRLVYYETYDDVHKAIGREKHGVTGAKKIARIEARNPRSGRSGGKMGSTDAIRGRVNER